jgi:Zn-finger nucleic acid-binding protein
MTSFFADKLELDRCPQCEGLWLDMDEVERLHGLKNLTISPTDVAATCPRGHGALRTGGIDQLKADVCPRCRGAFIAEAPFEQAPAAVTRQAVAAVARLTAICDRCGKRVAADEGAVSSAGFECRACQSGKAPQEGDRVFNLIGNVLDSLKR